MHHRFECSVIDVYLDQINLITLFSISIILKNKRDSPDCDRIYCMGVIGH